MTGSLFPPHVRGVDDALDFPPLWAESFGGILRDGTTAIERANAANDLVLIGPGENHRVPSAPRSLLDIAEKVVTTHISRL